MVISNNDTRPIVACSGWFVLDHLWREVAAQGRRSAQTEIADFVSDQSVDALITAGLLEKQVRLGLPTLYRLTIPARRLESALRMVGADRCSP